MSCECRWGHSIGYRTGVRRASLWRAGIVVRSVIIVIIDGVTLRTYLDLSYNVAQNVP